MTTKTARRNPIARLLNMLTSTRTMTAYTDLPYADDPRHMLDVYVPLNRPQGQLLPVVMFVHGGSWAKGDKADYVFLAEALTSAGLIAVIINYRLAPQVQFPAFVEDAAAALAWVYQHGSDYGADASNIMLLGHSAGAFNVVEMLVQPQYLQAVQMPVSAVSCAVAIAGPYCYDFSTDPTAYAFPSSLTLQQAMPALHVTATHLPPLYLLAAENDTLVDISNLQAMQQALLAAGATVNTIIVPKVSHISIMAAFAKRARFLGDSWGIFSHIARKHQP